MATQTHPTILHELKELDRLLHRLTERVKTEEVGEKSAHDILKELKGVLKGRDIENSLEYQRRIRREDDEHRMLQV